MRYGEINQAGLPTRGLTYQKMLDNLRECQELAAIMSHLVGLEGTIADQALAQGWIKIAENFARIEKVITHMATGRLN
jgi:hypothetical protein